MKFIGQYIQDLIARFRNDVYLEDVSTGTIASGANLGLDSNNKIVKNTVGGGGTTDLTSDVTGVLPIANGGTNSNSASDARTALGVDPSGTDNSTNVTLAGSLDYITLSGQEITRNAIDLAADVTGVLPVGNTAAKVTSIVAGDGIDVSGATGDVTVTAETASATNPGVVELATTAETTTGTDATRAVTPDGLKDGYQGSTNVTTLGSITTGVWRGTAIDQTYLVGQSGTNTGDQTTVSGNAGTATKLATTRALQVTLSETDSANFDGSAAVTDIGVTGTLAVGNGGTGLTSISTLLNSNVTSVSGNAGTATALATARDIAGVAFDGTGDISLNNNAITNGAGYTTNTGDIDRVRISTSSGNAEVSSGNADFTLSGTTPIGVTNSGTTITVAASDASTSAKGVASFSSDNFAASSGAISIKAGGVDLTDEVTGTLPAGNGGTGVTDVKQIITRQAFQCNFIDDIGTTKHYLPLAGIQENTVRYQDEAAMLAPCDGRVASVTLKMENLGGASGDITFGVEVAENPGTGFAQTWTTVETETFSIGSGDNHDTFHFHFTQSTAGANSGTSKHFDSTMMWAISIQSSDSSLGGDGGNDERWFATAVVEWDWSTYLGTGGTTTKYTSVP